MPATARASMWYSIKALPATLSKGLGVCKVSGRMRSPLPAAKIIAFIDTPLAAAGCPSTAAAVLALDSVPVPVVCKQKILAHPANSEACHPCGKYVQKYLLPSGDAATPSSHNHGQTVQRQKAPAARQPGPCSSKGATSRALARQAS